MLAQAQSAAGDAASQAKSAAGGAQGSAQGSAGDVAQAARSAAGDARGAAQGAGKQLQQATPDLSANPFEDIAGKVRFMLPLPFSTSSGKLCLWRFCTTCQSTVCKGQALFACS